MTKLGDVLQNTEKSHHGSEILQLLRKQDVITLSELSTLIFFKSSVIYEKYSAKDESYSIVKHNVAFLSQEIMQVTKTEQ